MEESPEIYVLHDGQQQGPFTKKEIGERLVWEELSLDDLWSRSGDQGWSPITTIFPKVPNLRWLYTHSWWILALAILFVIVIAAYMGHSEKQMEVDARAAFFAGLVGFALGTFPFGMGCLTSRPVLGKIAGISCGLIGAFVGGIAAVVACVVFYVIIKRKAATSP